MDDSALKAALRNLLAKGEKASDNKLRKFAASKKAPPVVEEACPECEKPMMGGKCEACGYEPQDEESGLAEALEMAAEA